MEVMTSDHALDENKLRLTHDDLVEEFIDRRNAEIPETFVPSANGIALVDCKVLWLAYRPGSRLSVGQWVGRAREGLFMKFSDNHFLSVRRYGKLWSIERLKMGTITDEVLAFAFGPTPILLDDHKLARMLARQCHPSLREEARCVCWIPMTA